MSWARFLTSLALVALLSGTTAVSSACAQESRVPIPSPPKGKGEQCVRDTAFMRANHMNLLLHQRDETVQKGIRTKKYSLKECVACHAVPGSDGQPVSYEDPKNFCRECHDYTAVKIDCFECHASKPPSKQANAAPNYENGYRVSGVLPL
jgi:predicted CXXCH cytochrome family protein